MKKEKIKDLYFFHPKTKIQAGEGNGTGEFPFYTSSEQLTKRIDKAVFNNRGLVFGTGGKASIHLAEGRYSVSTDCYVLGSSQERVNIKYTYYYLAGNIQILARGFKGAGLKHISKKYIEEIEIPYPEISIQDKIVAVLDKANSLIIKRERVNFIFDELLRATFLDLFGDPTTNSKGWGKINFVDVVKNENGKRVAVKQADRDLREGIYPYYGATGMIDTIDDYKFDGEFLLIAEDGKNLLFRKKNNAFLVEGKFWVNNHAHVLSFNGVANLRYLKYFLNCLDFRPYITGIDQVKLNKENLERIPVPIPPIDLQNKFSELEIKLEEIKSKIPIESLETFLQSLIQKSFNGELSFNIDLELDALIFNEDKVSIQSDIVYLQRLIDRLKGQEFENKEIYNKAKNILFTILKEEKNVKQEYKKEHKRVNSVIG